jgi:hypothetical protein
VIAAVIGALVGAQLGRRVGLTYGKRRANEVAWRIARELGLDPGPAMTVARSLSKFSTDSLVPPGLLKGSPRSLASSSI